MKKEQGDSFSLDKVNLSEMARRTGISRKRLRPIQKNGYRFRSLSFFYKQSYKQLSIELFIGVKLLFQNIPGISSFALLYNNAFIPHFIENIACLPTTKST